VALYYILELKMKEWIGTYQIGPCFEFVGGVFYHVLSA